MRNMFHGYYRPTAAEFDEIWDNCVIVLDTNVLLNLYRYSEATFASFMNVLKAYSDNLWMPYAVGLEFHKNRHQCKTDQHRYYSTIEKTLNSFIETFSEKLKECRYHRFIDSKKIQTSFKRRITAQIKEINLTKSKHEKLFEKDEILLEINKLFQGKVGMPFDEKKFAELCKQGKIRYDDNTPPGFKDKAKHGHSQYGDYFIWEAIIEKASNDKNNIIFVTDDGKDDWWFIHQGKTLGPRPELREEFKKRASQSIYFYKPDRFLDYAGSRKKMKVDKAVAVEVSNVSKQLQFSTSDWIKRIASELSKNYKTSTEEYFIDFEHDIAAKREFLDNLKKSSSSSFLHDYFLKKELAEGILRGAFPRPGQESGKFLLSEDFDPDDDPDEE